MAKRSLWKRIKDWLTGESSSSSGMKKASRVSNYGGGGGTSYTKSTRSGLSEEEKTKKRLNQQKQKQDSVTKSLASMSKRTDALSSGQKATPPTAKTGKERVVAKLEQKERQSQSVTPKKSLPTDPKELARKRSQAQATASLNRIKADISEDKAAHKADKEARQAKRQEKHEAFHAATNHRYDVAEKGISEEERRRRAQNIRTAPLGEMMGGRDDEALDVMEAKMKYDKTGESVRRGVVNALSANTLDLAEKKLNKGERKEAEEYYQANKNKAAETVGSLAGGLLLYGGTAGTFENLGTKAVGRAAQTQLGKKLGAEALGRTMAGNGVKAGLARSLVGDAIQDTTLGLLDTAASVSQRDDLKTPGDYAKAIAQGQAVNYGMGLAGNALFHGIPVARRAWGDFADESRKLRIVPKDVADAADTAQPRLQDIEAKAPKAEPKSAEARLAEVDAELNEIRSRINDPNTSAAEKEALDKQSRPLYKEKNKLESDIREAKAAEKKAKAAEKKAQKTKKIDTTKSAGGRMNDTRLAPEAEPNVDNAINRIREADENLGKRLDELQREYADVNVRAEQGDVDAIARRDEIRAEVQSIIDEYRAKANVEPEPTRVTPPEEEAAPKTPIEPKEEATVEPPKPREDRGIPYEDEPDEVWDRIRAADEERMRRNEMSEATQREWDNGTQSMDTPRSGKQGQNIVNKEIQEAAEDVGYGNEWTNGENFEGYSAREADEIWSTEKVDGEIRTKRGGYTLATSMGDVHFAGEMKDAIADGSFDRYVRHNKQEYGKAVERFVKYVEGKGGKDGNEGLTELITRLENYATGKKALTSNEMRDQLYDILVAVDWANGNKDNPLAEKVFMSSIKAGAEQSSVGGLTLYQWHRMAMSSPEHRAKVVKEQIEDMFNRSRKFRKKYLGSVKKKLGDVSKYQATDDAMPIDRLMAENPELTKGMKDAFDRLENAKSKDEVEAAASALIVEARKIMPVTAFDQLTQWRYVAMLSNPKTHIKNVVGNIYSGTLGQTSVALASSLENKIAKDHNLVTAKNVDLSKGINADQDVYLKSASGFSNKARTNAKVGVFEGIELRNAESKLKDAKRKLAGAADDEKEALQKQVDDLTAKVEKAKEKFEAKKIKEDKDLLGSKAQTLFHEKSVDELLVDATKFEKQTYGAVSSGLDKASKFIGGALETSDAVAVERIYRETAEKILKANDYERFVTLAKGEGKEAAAAKAMVERIEEYAAQHAAYRAALDTYRNYNAVATWMNKVVKNTIYNADAAWYKKAGGFALHAVMPFTKVPTNIMKRSADYSPIGLIQGKKMLNEAIESGNYAEINKAVERLAEGSIGTGIAMLGMSMCMLDPDGMIITTRLDRDDERDKAKKDRGYMDYSVKIGNRDYTLEWATPTASTFFVGVEAGRMFRHVCDSIADNNGLDFDPTKAFEACGEVMTRLIEPTLQLGMFQGVNSILEDSMENRYDEANINPIFKALGAITNNYISSMSPAVMNGLSKAFAKSDYYISGKNDLDYRKNLLIAKIPGLSAAKLDAKTNAWGEIRNERKTPKDRVARGAEALLAPWNSSEITWDETDDALYDLYDKTGDDKILPKVYYDYNNEGIDIGRNSDTALHIDIDNKDGAQYNIARGKSGSDAMSAALESVIFNRWYKDEKGKYTIEDESNYSSEMKAKKVAEFKGKGVKDVVKWVMDQPQYKNATPAEQRQIIKEVIGNSSKEQSIGAKRASELAVAKRHDISEEEYNYKNEVPANAQAALDAAIEAGIVTYEMATDYARNAGKTYYRTDQKGEEGGSVSTYYNKKESMEYLAKKGYSYEEAEALYNAFKNPTAKEFSGIDTSSGGRGSGYRGYRRYGSGRGHSAKAKVPTPKKIAASSLKKGEALVSKSSKSSSKTTVPTLKRVEAKIDLPTVKTKR